MDKLDSSQSLKPSSGGSAVPTISKDADTPMKPTKSLTASPPAATSGAGGAEASASGSSPFTSGGIAPQYDYYNYNSNAATNNSSNSNSIAYRNAINDLTKYRGTSSRTPVTAYKNSITHPINVSWMIPPWLNVLLQEDVRLPKGVLDLNDLASRECMPSPAQTSDYHHYPLSAITPTLEDALARALQLYPDWRPRGNIGLCSCPGKKVRLDGPVNGRAKIERDLDLDFTRLRQLGCRRVICCLFDEELAFLGSPFPQYLEAATKHGIDIVRIPMVEGSTPETFAEMEAVLDKIDEITKAGDNVIAHCRGGVGRAAVVACCWMLRQGLLRDNRSVISWVRRYRTSKAIETEEQEFYLEGYHVWKTANDHPAFAKHYENELRNRRQRKDNLYPQQRQAQELEILRTQRKAFQEEEDVEQRARELRAESPEATAEPPKFADPTTSTMRPGCDIAHPSFWSHETVAAYLAATGRDSIPPMGSVVPEDELQFCLVASSVPPTPSSSTSAKPIK